MTTRLVSPAARRGRRSTTLLASLLGAVVLLALIGPALAPHTATAPVAPPFTPPGPGIPLGTDQLGRDLLSRVLLGGAPVILTSAVAAVAGTLLGGLIGLAAALLGHRRPRTEGAVLRPLDALAALPPLMVLLLVLTALPGRAGIAVAVAVAGVPLSARILRAAAAPIVARAHVEAAIARGERWTWLLGRELAPLVAGVLVADIGIRFVAAIYLVTAAGFLGLTAGDPDWGLLIVEALPGAALAPLTLAVPVLLVALLAVTTNLLADDALRRARTVLA